MMDAEGREKELTRQKLLYKLEEKQEVDMTIS